MSLNEAIGPKETALYLNLIALITICLTIIPGVALAARPFYEGKTIRLIVGYSAGGGSDLYSRLLARHMGKHIPGDPKIIVEKGTPGFSVGKLEHKLGIRASSTAELVFEDCLYQKKTD
jgi:hypothetical protein